MKIKRSGRLRRYICLLCFLGKERSPQDVCKTQKAGAPECYNEKKQALCERAYTMIVQAQV